MRKVSVNVYQFDELSDDAKQRALESLRYVNVDGVCNDWADHTIENFKKNLTEQGFDVDKVSYSGFCSQGDGASFTGRIKDFKKFCMKTGFEFPKDNEKFMAIAAEDWDLSIERDEWHYYHSYTVTPHVRDYHLNTDYTKAAIALEKFMGDWQVEQSNQLYKELEDYYFQLTSNEEVREAIIANDWEFWADGTRYKGE